MKVQTINFQDFMDGSYKAKKKAIPSLAALSIFPTVSLSDIVLNPPFLIISALGTTAIVIAALEKLDLVHPTFSRIFNSSISMIAIGSVIFFFIKLFT